MYRPLSDDELRRIALAVVAQAARDVVNTGDYHAGIFLLDEENSWTGFLGIEVHESDIARMGRACWRTIRAAMKEV